MRTQSDPLLGKTTPQTVPPRAGVTLGLLVAGAALGAVAWPLSTWAAGLSIVLPVAVALCRRKWSAFTLAGGYYLGALSSLPVSALQSPIVGAEVLPKLTLWLGGSALAAIMWTMVVDPRRRAGHVALRLVLAWSLTLLTPLGLMGAVHPAWGWAFDAKGSWGLATLVLGPVVTAFTVYHVLSERDRTINRWAWHSARGLALIIAFAVIGKGLGDQTVVPRQAGQAAAVQSRWGRLGEAGAVTLEERIARTKLSLAALGGADEPGAKVGLVLTGVNAFGVHPVEEVASFARETNPATDAGAIAFGMGVSVTESADGEAGITRARPAVVVLREGEQPVLMCATDPRNLVFDWPGLHCLRHERIVAVTPLGAAGGLQQTMRLVIADEALPGGALLLKQLTQPAHSLALVTSSVGAGEALAARVQAKHFNALAMVTGVPHMMATNTLSRID